MGKLRSGRTPSRPPRGWWKAPVKHRAARVLSVCAGNTGRGWRGIDEKATISKTDIFYLTTSIFLI